MKKIPAIACLFVDIGGVLVSNGWDDPPHELAAEKFHLSGPWSQLAVAG